MVISIFLSDLRGGGAEKVAVNIANSFVQRGYAVDIVLLSAKGEFIDNLDPKIRVVDLKVQRMRWALISLLRYFRQVRPSAFLACMWPLTVIALWARMLTRTSTRLVVSEHTTWSQSELLQRLSIGWQARTSMHHFFPKADGIVAVSKGAADDLANFASLQRSSISFIYNPIVANLPSLEYLPPAAPSAWWKGSHRRVLAVGTLKPIKDYHTLLNAFAALRQQIDARLLILGEGECRAALEAHARRLGIADSVFMPGFVKEPAPYFRHADLHVLSSTGEGFGNVIVEALAEGTPVVSTDCPSGPREILCDGQFGRLVPVGDVDGLAAAMQASLTSKHDRAALIARALDFSIEKAVDQYEALLFPVRSASQTKPSHEL